MENRLFNSPFEMELRTVLLLSVASNIPFTIDRMVALDFIICYAADFNLPYANLHGQNSFKYGEISNRRMLVQESVKSLVMKGLISVTIDRGYLFSISEDGKRFARKFTSSYAKDYKKIAKMAAKKYKNDSDEDIMAMIQLHSARAVRN